MSLAKTKLISIIPAGKEEKLMSVLRESRKMLGNYLKSYGAVIGLTYIETLAVFLIFRVKCAFILSLISGILIAYVLVVIIRHLVEPKIVSSSLGMVFCIFMVVFYTILHKVEIL